MSAMMDRAAALGQWILIAGVVALIAGCPPQGQGPSTGPDQQPGPGGVAVQPEPPAPAHEAVWPPNAVWVVRQNYDSPEQIAAVMERSREAGFNTVLFQVRGEAVAYHNSKIEPTVYDEKAPDFDQLTVAVREAHRQGLALHAWVNVMPGWKGRQPPTNPNQLYNAHPDWFWVDQDGQRQPLSNFYVSVNPCLPEVRQYLVRVFQEIVANYKVDGLHMDYIRFPSELDKGRDFPRDERTVALYKKSTGKRPQDDVPRWTTWRNEQVTQLVKDINSMVDRTRPGCMLTAALGPKVEDHRKYYFQDGARWLRENLIDAGFVMNYTGDNREFRRRQEEWMKAVGRKLVAPGLGPYKHPSWDVTAEQLAMAREFGRGVGVFSYGVIQKADAAKLAQFRAAMR